jgi:Flp pilus assembly protein TadG
MMKLTCLGKRFMKRPRRRRCRGAELVEFTLTFFPFLMFITVLLSISWGIFAKSALQFAVKAAVRSGITINKEGAGSSDLTTLVKNLVKTNSFGFLKDTSLVTVHYYQPPLPGSSASMTDVSTVTTGTNPGNSAGNVMVVAISGYSLPTLIPRIFRWNAIDKSPSTINVSSADLIEQIPSNDLAPLGTAP